MQNEKSGRGNKMVERRVAGEREEDKRKITGEKGDSREEKKRWKGERNCLVSNLGIVAGIGTKGKGHKDQLYSLFSF